MTTTMAAQNRALGETYMTLDRLKVGQRAVVTCVEINEHGSMHLLEMGLTPGIEVAVTRIAPLGGPINIVLRGYHLSVRRSEARCVSVTSNGATGEGATGEGATGEGATGYAG